MRTSSVQDFVFSPYGWALALGTLCAVYIYNCILLPYIEKHRNSIILSNRKKFDEDVKAKVGKKVRATRERQQKEHDRVAAELKRREEEKEQEKLELMRKKEEGESVLRHAMISHALHHATQIHKGHQSAEQIVEKFVSTRPVVVFSKTSCPFCRKAKAALALYRLDPSQFEFIELDERSDIDGEQLLNELQRRTGSRTVPRVFIGGECIGGGDDTVRLQKEGTLDILVREALLKYGSGNDK